MSPCYFSVQGYFYSMLKKIVISRFNNTAAILQNSKIQEITTINNAYQINDIYLGSIHKIFTSINAAFVDLGNNKKSGFIHINDIKCLKKNQNLIHINDILSINQLVLVQIAKEPTLNKGPRLTACINLFGKYLVLMPFSNTISVSSKIYDANERSYLHAIAILLKPATMGLLIRSSACGINEEILLEDLQLLKQQWYFIQKLAINSAFPCLLYKDEDLVKKIIRDFYSDDIQTIVVDSLDSLGQIRYYLNRWRCISPDTNLKLQLFNQSESILEKFHINSAITNALRSKVDLSIGGYLFIESYEAFTIIDVNSGSFNPSDNSAENILRTNCYAATEIAYQLRLRNTNGVIIVDFIDMESHRDQLQLLEHFARILSIDKAKSQIIQLSKLGLVELTRRRREQSLFELFYEKYKSHSALCPNFLNSGTQELGYYDDFNKSINALFFNCFFYKTIYVSKYLSYSSNYLQIVNLQKVNISHLSYSLMAPLLLYSQVVNSSLGIR